MRGLGESRRRELSIFVIAALFAATLAVVGAGGVAAADTCPSPPSGTWIGSWSSSRVAYYGSSEDQLSFSGTVVTGSIVNITGSLYATNGDPIAGTLSCNMVSGTVGTTGYLSGTVSADGLQMSGTYAQLDDAGTWQVAYVQNAVSATGTTLTTDSGSTGATPSQPLQTTITSPTAGALAIGVASSDGAVSTGYNLLGRVVEIEAPPATPSMPLSFTFEADVSLTGGTPASAIVPFRNGVAVPDCTGGPGVAAPDPCVASRADLPNGNVSLTVLSSAASVWALGTTLAVSIGSASVVEGNTGKSRTLSFPVTLTSRPTTSDVVVQYAIQPNGSATGGTKSGAGVDFKTKTGTLTFVAGTSTTTKYVNATVYSDVDGESDETFDVVLSNPTGGYALGNARATGTIIDDDSLSPFLVANVGDVSVWEGDAGRANTARVAVNLTDPAPTTVSVTVSVGGGTASAGQDYKAAFTKTLTFLVGQRQKTIAVPVLPNTVHQGDRTITVTLSNASPGDTLFVWRYQGTITIRDDD